jgi:uncharacterized damage-inducible protein DinB
MTPDAICRLYDYTYWAFECVWNCIIQLTDEQFIRSIDYSIGSIRNHVVHLMSGTQRWIKRVQGAEIPPHLPFDDYTTRKATKVKWDEMKGDVLDYIRSLNQAQLDEIVHWEIHTRGVSCDNRRWELLMHVVNHATDHRAQMLAMLHHHFGVKTVEHDMIFYLLGAELPA